MRFKITDKAIFQKLKAKLRKIFWRRPSHDADEELEKEATRLRERLWRARGRRSRITGSAFLILSGVFLLIAYYTRYIVFEVISILSLLLGVVFVFTGTESYVRTDIANRTVTSALVPLSALLASLDASGKAVYIPPASDQNSCRVFIPRAQNVSREAFLELARGGEEVVLDEKGILLPSIGGSLLQLYEEELGDLRKMTFDYLVEWLPRVLVDGLHVAERMEITDKTEDVSVKLAAPAFRYACQNSNTKTVCEKIGCPECGSIIEAVAKNTNRVVYFEKCEYNTESRILHIAFRKGQTLKNLEKIAGDSS